ncbi:MAG: NUDIX domain-containing protein [Thiotrichales bacterium]|nr:NUDIX domain-containing protein [Thiotrichales bacterium]
MTEQDASQDTADFERFAVAVDIAVFTVQPPAWEHRRRDFQTPPARLFAPTLHIALVRRDIEPFLGRWALPGGFVRRGEDLNEAAVRALAEETGLHPESDWYLEQLGSDVAPHRDARQRVLSVAFFAVAHELPPMLGGGDAAWAEMQSVDQLDRRTLAFHHARIIDDGLERVRALLEYTTFASRFLAPTFAVSELQAVYEAVWNVRLDSGNFRRNLEKCQGFVRVDADGRREHPPHRRQRGRPPARWSAREAHRRDRSGALLARALASRARGTSMLGIRTWPAEPRLDFVYLPVAPGTYDVMIRNSVGSLGTVRKVREVDVDRWHAVSPDGEDLSGSFDTRIDAAYHLWSLAQGEGDVQE